MQLRFLPLLLLAAATCASADDNVLLVQNGPGGARVWHVEGPSQLDDDMLLELMVVADPLGDAVLETPLGPARAEDTGRGVIIHLPQAKNDPQLLVDQDACGHIQVWHSEGKTHLPEDELAQLLISALPGGGPRMRLSDGRYAKAFLGKLGATITLWRLPQR